MNLKMKKTLELVKTRLSFLLCLLTLIGLFILGWFKDFDVASSMMEIAAIYVIGRSVVLGSHGWATSKDPNADTKGVVEQLKDQD
jgi:hypothetical protein